MEHANWVCPKCRNREFETDQFVAGTYTVGQLLSVADDGSIH